MSSPSSPSLSSGLVRVPSTGGQPQKLTEPDEGASGYAHGRPQFLPELAVDQATGTREMRASFTNDLVISRVPLRVRICRRLRRMSPKPGIVLPCRVGSRRWLR